MRLFLDNDIVLKLSSIGLLNQIEAIFNCNADSIFILAAAKYYIGKNKSLAKEYSSEVIESALEVIEKYKVIPDEFIDDDKLIELSSINGIDSGEQILFSLSIPDNDYLILTGDKKAIKSLANSPHADYHKRKIVCLEYLLLEIIKDVDFIALTEKIQSNNYCGDSVIKFCFSQTDLTKGKAIEGFNSYYSALKKEAAALIL